MTKDVRCPACGGKNCLPMLPTFGKKGIEITIGECKKCGIKMTVKDYYRRIDGISKKSSSEL